MGRKLEWELSGKTDVPEKMAKAKAATEGFDGAANAVGKKFREAFKDIALGFIAPVALLHSAINFITTAIENRKRDIEEALAFADTAESKLYASQQEIEAAKQARERKKTEEDKKKAEEMRTQARIEFFKTTPEGQARVSEIMAINQALRAGGFGAAARGMPILSADRIAEQLAQANEKLTPELQAAFDKFFGDAAQKRAEADAAKAGEATAQKVSDVTSNVIGVGASPQLDTMREQLEVQQDMANSLRALVEAGQVQQGFRPEKGFDLGGMGSAGRTVFPR